jgi:hypothetical protein
VAVTAALHLHEPDARLAIRCMREHA